MSNLWVPESASVRSTVISASPKEAVRNMLTTGTKFTATRRTRKDPRTTEPCRQAREPPLHCGGPAVENPLQPPAPDLPLLPEGGAGGRGGTPFTPLAKALSPPNLPSLSIPSGSKYSSPSWAEADHVHRRNPSLGWPLLYKVCNYTDTFK